MLFVPFKYFKKPKLTNWYQSFIKVEEKQLS